MALESKKKKVVYEMPVYSRDADVYILYPKYNTEFDIQYKLYTKISDLCYELDNGREIKSEVTILCDGIKSRVDLMVFNKNKEALCGIEVKRFNHEVAGYTKEHYLNYDNKQNMKYKFFTRLTKIPIIYCFGEQDIKKTIKAIRKYIS